MNMYPELRIEAGSLVVQVAKVNADRSERVVVRLQWFSAGLSWHGCGCGGVGPDAVKVGTVVVVGDVDGKCALSDVL